MLTATLTTLLCAAVLAGCGEDDADRPTAQSPQTIESTSPGGGQPSEPAGSDPGGRKLIRATSVSVLRSGGIAGVETSLRFEAGSPPPQGYSRAQLDAVLEAASDPQLLGLELDPLPEDACCDRFSYRVTVAWEDGQRQTFRTVDGVRQPEAFQQLLSAVL